jgi:molybdopterin converting factor subunit 1
VTVRVRLFAKARDLAGTPILELTLPVNATVGDLRRALAERAPQLRPIASGLLVAINSQYATDAARVPPNAEIACFPPVSGG